MKREDLEKLGLTEEALEKAGLEKDAIDKIMALHGKDINSHKSSIETLTTEKTALENQLKEANSTIEGFKELEPEKLQKSVDEWKTKAEKFEQDAKTAKEEADKQIEQYKFNTELAETLKNEFKAKDPDDIIPRLNLEKIQHDEGKGFVGLKEQLEPLQEAKAYLFDSESEEEPLPQFVKSGKPPKVIDDKVVAAARQYAGVDDPQSEK